MKRILNPGALLLSLAFILGFALPVPAQNPGDAIFSGIQVHTINLRFTQPDYMDSLKYFYAQGDEQYIAAQAVVDGVTMENVGVRLKGNSSYNHPNDKKSFRLAFDEFVSSGRWDGLKGVHLNNMWGDPSFMREKIHLDFLRDAGIPAPRGNYARLLINDTLFAFFSLVEHVDKTLLESRFANKSGDLFKAVDGIAGSDSLLSDFRWLGSDPAPYESRYELKTDGSLTAWPQLIDFIDTLAHHPDPASALPRKAEMQQLYRVFAADNLFGNLDSYTGSGRNFYVYFHAKTGKLNWVVWDVGLSFGAYGGGVARPENMSVTWLAKPESRPLQNVILSTPALKAEYLQTLCSLHAELFRPDRLFPHIDSVAALIRPYVAEDQRKMYTMQQFETNIVSEIDADGGGSLRKPGLKSFVTAREATVQSQLDALGISCALGVESAGSARSAAIELAQNHPNPFAASTTITYYLPADGDATMAVYDALGREVATLLNGAVRAGSNAVVFDAAALPSGVYRCELRQGNTHAVRMLTLRH